jgi:hypothetical protein
MDWSPPHRPALRPAGFVEPCIPTLTEKPLPGSASCLNVNFGLRLRQPGLAPFGFPL